METGHSEFFKFDWIQDLSILPNGNLQILTGDSELFEYAPQSYIRSHFMSMLPFNPNLKNIICDYWNQDITISKWSPTLFGQSKEQQITLSQPTTTVAIRESLRIT